MNKKINLVFRTDIPAVALGLMGLLLCSPLSGAGAAGQSSQSQEQSQAAKPATSASPATPATSATPDKPPISKEEDDDIKAFAALTTPQSKEIITAGETFLGKYPTSLYRSSVYFRLVNAYLGVNQAANAITTGEKAIVENPDNADVLALVSTILPRVVTPNSLDFEQKLGEAERFAKHAIEVANAAPKPEGLTDEQYATSKNQRLGMAHYGLGLVAYMRGNVASYVEEFDQSSKLDPAPEPLLFFLLGTGEMKLQKFSDAGAAFDRCAQDPWQWQDRCKSGQEQAKKAAASPAPAKP